MNTTTTKPVYRLDSAKKNQFVGILLLNYIINEGGKLSILMPDDFKVLDKLVINMVTKGYLKVTGAYYTPTVQGQEVLKTFMNRYLEYLKIYDVFCSVDLEAGEFAYEKYYDFEEDAAWDKYVNQERFEDVRIAVAEFKKLDPKEIVFMSFINEGRFDLVSKGWQFDIYSGLVWGEIEKICNTALSVDEINQGDTEVMQNILRKGAEVAINLLKIEDQRKAEEQKEMELAASLQKQDEEETEEVVEETVVTEYMPDYYYQPYYAYNEYYDPFYISPIWALPLLLLY